MFDKSLLIAEAGLVESASENVVPEVFPVTCALLKQYHSGPETVRLVAFSEPHSAPRPCIAAAVKILVLMVSGCNA